MKKTPSPENISLRIGIPKVETSLTLFSLGQPMVLSFALIKIGY
jgi:hypothetical protein